MCRYIHFHLIQMKTWNLPGSILSCNVLYKRGQSKETTRTIDLWNSFQFTLHNKPTSLFSIRRMTAWGQTVSSWHLHCEVNTSLLHMPFSATVKSLKEALWTLSYHTYSICYESHFSPRMWWRYCCTNRLVEDAITIHMESTPGQTQHRCQDVVYNPWF